MNVKNAKNCLMILLAAAMMIGLAGCSVPPAPSQANAPSVQDARETQTPAAPADEGQPSAGADDRVYEIGIIQIIEHPALNASYEGFVEALSDNGYGGDRVKLDYQNAQGDMNNLSTIADRFVSRKKDLVLAIATDSAQAMLGKTNEIPIIGTAITSYSGAGLVESEEAPGGNVTGTSDMNPIEAQIDLLAELVPDVQTVGLIYNSSEDNSVIQINLAKARIEAMGLKWAESTVTNVNDIQQGVQSLVNKCEAIYIPTDNILASAMATVHGVTGPAKIPTICGESNMVLQGGLATLGIDYRELGYKAGVMAAKVLGGADTASMPIEYADDNYEVTINGQVAREIGYTVPQKYQNAVINP